MSGAALPSGLGQAFTVAAAELGFCSASWLFVREIGAAGGEPLVHQLRDEYGRAYPVLDAVAAAWLGGARAPEVDPAPAAAACRGLRRLIVVGLEAPFLDALLPHLEGVEVALLQYSLLEADWPRMLANYGGRVASVDLMDFQLWGGARSGLLTFLYGRGARTAHVRPAWLRAMGGDVRTQFRSIIGWDVLRAPMYVYPRWLMETALGEFSHVV